MARLSNRVPAASRPPQPARSRPGGMAEQTYHAHGTPEIEPHVDEPVHLVLSLIELDILVDALRSVGNVEFAERLEMLLRRAYRPPAAGPRHRVAGPLEPRA